MVESISMAVKLSFETIYDPVLEKKVKGFEIVRLKTLVMFKHVGGDVKFVMELLIQVHM